MASVSSLDQDMRKLRMSRYTPQAANEARAWIEDTLGERLPTRDLLDALKDGTVLCRYIYIIFLWKMQVSNQSYLGLPTLLSLLQV